MAQWANLQRMRLYISCEKSGGLHLAEPCLMAVSRQADEIQVRFKNFKVAIDQNI